MPVFGDVWLIVHATVNLGAGIMYCEEWSVGANAWEVVPMVPWLRMVDVTVNPNIAEDTIIIPPPTNSRTY